MTHFDVLILGQGIAGSCLAWALDGKGISCAVIDDGIPATASRVAAGLITPVTGRRLATTWRLDEFWSVAQSFYRGVEQVTGGRLLDEAPALRLFADRDEQAVFTRRRGDLQQVPAVREIPPTSIADPLVAPLGGFEMEPAARLDVAAFLRLTRELFTHRGAFYPARVADSEIDVDGDRIVIGSLGLSADRIVFCQGVEASAGKWFAPVRFNPAKGEILTVGMPDFGRSSPIHRGIWMAGDGDSIFRVGATYDWERLDCIPTAEGKKEIAESLARLVRVPFEIMDHVAAVRPVAHDFRPMIGLHPEDSRLGILNGLGSKGALQAPFFAEQLAQALFDVSRGQVPTLDREVDVQRYWRKRR